MIAWQIDAFEKEFQDAESEVSINNNFCYIHIYIHI
jgi:hypothetical protein